MGSDFGAGLIVDNAPNFLNQAPPIGPAGIDSGACAATRARFETGVGVARERDDGERPVPVRRFPPPL